MGMSPAARVGMVTVFAASLMAGSVVWLTRYHVRHDGYPLTLVYGDVSGLTSGANILLMGVSVGRVVSVTPQDRQVLVGCEIESRATHIFEGSRFKIYSKGLIGEKALEIFPPQPFSDRLIKPGAVIRGEDPVRLDTTFEAADQVVKSIRRYADSPEAKATFEQSLGAIKGTFAKFNSLSDHLDNLVAEANAFVSHGRGLAGTIHEEDIRAMVLDLRFLSHGLRQSYQALLGSPEQRNAAQEAIDNLASLSNRLDHVARQIDAFTSDPKLKSDLADLVNQSKTLLASIRGPQDRKTPILSPQLELQGVTRTGQETLQGPNLEAQDLVANLSLRLAVGETSLVAGTEELGKNTAFTFTWGVPQFFAPNAGFHVGLVRSAIGMGVDYQPLPGTEIKAELYDPARFKMRLSAALFPDFMAHRYGLNLEWIRLLGAPSPSDPGFDSLRLGLQWRPLD